MSAMAMKREQKGFAIDARMYLSYNDAPKKGRYIQQVSRKEEICPSRKDNQKRCQKMSTSPRILANARTTSSSELKKRASRCPLMDRFQRCSRSSIKLSRLRAPSRARSQVNSITSTSISIPGNHFDQMIDLNQISIINQMDNANHVNNETQASSSSRIALVRDKVD
jgi:hypothetical protein